MKGSEYLSDNLCRLVVGGSKTHRSGMLTVVTVISKVYHDD